MYKNLSNLDDIVRIAINYAYKLKPVQQAPATSSQLLDGWHLLCISQDHETTRLYGYKAVALINRQTQQIHIANAGTQLKEKYDLWDDIKVFCGFTPNKLLPAKNLMDRVTQLVGGIDEVEKYKYSSSGHSLGAVVSDLVLLEGKSRGLNFEASVTFDNPGSKSSIRYVIKNKQFTGSIIEPLDRLADRCVEYNAPPNIINKYLPHFSTNINRVQPHRIVKRTVGDNKNKLTPPSTTSSVQYLYSTIKSMATACSSKLGLTTIAEQLESHKFSNVSALRASIVVPVVGWGKESPNATQIVLQESCSINSQLKRQESTGKDIVLIEQQQNESDLLHYTRSEYSFADYDRAQKRDRQQRIEQMLPIPPTAREKKALLQESHCSQPAAPKASIVQIQPAPFATHDAMAFEKQEKASEQWHIVDKDVDYRSMIKTVGTVIPTPVPIAHMAQQLSSWCHKDKGSLLTKVSKVSRTASSWLTNTIAAVQANSRYF